MAAGSDGATLDPTVAVGSETIPDAARLAVEIGREIGRYVVLEEVGAGGMGRVYRAYDPKLRREVALKRLRVAGGSSAAAQARMLREAQSMAQLSHPNVVPVYDVDADDGNLFIAMEYVDGATLRGWLADKRRGSREIIAAFIEAGEGLLAAHRHGIVHRDFKPTNVIVGRDGRSRVMDFGVARPLQSLLSSASDDAHRDDSDGASVAFAGSGSEALTEHGTVMGTPAYMAPEQHAGRVADARSDQYAFCIALWEALYGARPFEAKTLEELAKAKRAPLPRPPTSAGVPAAVHSIIVRGLSIDPDARWPTMAALLGALRRTQAGRGPWPAFGVAAVLLGLGGVYVGMVRASPCEQSGSEVDAVWSDSARQQVRDGLLHSGAHFAQSTIERVDAALEAYATELSAMHRDACEATHVRQEQSDEALDLRMTCLASRLEELRAAQSLLAEADATVAEKAVDVATGLTPISGCADLTALRSSIVPPADPQTAREVDETRESLASVRISLRAGLNADALETAAAMVDVAEHLGYEPLVAEAELVHALALWSDGNTQDARPKAERAFQSALRLSMRHLAAEAAVALTGIIHSQTGRASEARWLAEVGLALAEGDGTDAPLTAEAMLYVGKLHAEDERLLDAEPYFRGAVEHVEAAVGPEHPSLVALLASWSSMLGALERREEAERVATRARDLAQHAFGPDHPSTAAAIRQLAWRWMATGQFKRAEAGFTEAKAIYEASLGRDHPTTIGLLGPMAGSVAEQGRYEEAAGYILDAEKRLGSRVDRDHPMRASLSHNLATIRAMQGDHEAAVDRYRQATEIRRRLGMKADLAAALAKQAESLAELERFDEAEAALKEAEQLDIEAHAVDGNRSANPPLQLGKLARRRGDLKAARDHFETAWVFSAESTSSTDRAETALVLGQTLWDLGLERHRAHGLVKQAREVAEDSESDAAPDLADAARKWLATHPEPKSR